MLQRERGIPSVPRKLRILQSPRRSADLFRRSWAWKHFPLPRRGSRGPSEAFGGLSDEDNEEQHLEPAAYKRADGRHLSSARPRTRSSLALSASWAEDPLENVRPRSSCSCAAVGPVDAQPRVAPPQGVRELGQEATRRAAWSHFSATQDTPDPPSWTLQSAPLTERSPSRPPDVGER